MYELILTTDECAALVLGIELVRRVSSSAWNWTIWTTGSWFSHLYQSKSIQIQQSTIVKVVLRAAVHLYIIIIN